MPVSFPCRHALLSPSGCLGEEYWPTLDVRPLPPPGHLSSTCTGTHTSYLVGSCILFPCKAALAQTHNMPLAWLPFWPPAHCLFLDPSLFI